MATDLHRQLATLLNRGALSPALRAQLIGRAMAAKLPLSKCPDCPSGTRIGDTARGVARCLACGRSTRGHPAA